MTTDLGTNGPESVAVGGPSGPSVKAWVNTDSSHCTRPSTALA